MVLDEIKADLAEFLLHEMMSRTESLPGNFPDPNNAQANSFDAESFCVHHEEADI